MREDLQGYDAAEPPMEKIEGVEGDAEKLDQGVVPAGHQEQGNQVHHGHDAGSVSDGARDLGERAAVVDGNHAEDDVGGDVSEEEEELQSGRQSSHVDGRADLELAVMAFPEHGRVQQVSLKPRPLGGLEGKIPLAVIGEARHGADVLDQHGGQPPRNQGDRE